MITRELIKKLNFEQIGPKEGKNCWKTEVWFNDTDLWIHYDKPDPKLCSSFDATNGSLEEFIIWLTDGIHEHYNNILHEMEVY